MTENIEGGTYGEEVSREVADSLFTPDEQPTPDVSEASSEETAEEQVETQETEQPESSEETVPTEDGDAEPTFELEGESYTVEQITEALNDSRNKSEWQKSNTQKAQELSQREKELQSELDRIKGVMSDEEVVETMKDVLGEDHELFKESEVKFSDNAEETPTEEQPSVENERIEYLETQIREMQLKEQVAQEINALVTAHPELKEDGDAIGEVLDIAVDRNIPNLEDAFILAQSRATEQSAIMKAMKKLEEAEDLKAIPEVDHKTKGDHSPTVTKSPDFDHAREVAFKDYQLFE